MPVDHIAELLGDQPTIDESQLPDSGTTDADLEGSGADDGGMPSADAGQQQQQQQPGQQPGQQRVPLSALQEERQRRQELQEQLRQQMELSTKMQERFEQMVGRFTQPQQPQTPPEQVEIPNWQDDPEAHINALRQVFEQRIAQQDQVIQQFQQHFQQQAQHQQVANRALAEEAEFAKVNPDYQQAADYFTARKAAEYTALGLDPATVQMQLQRDFTGLAVHAQKIGKSAPEILYGLAKAMGYSGQQQQGQQQQQQQKPAPTSLSGLPASPTSPDEQRGVSLESIANMTDAEFDKFWKEMERGSRQRPRI